MIRLKTESFDIAYGEHVHFLMISYDSDLLVIYEAFNIMPSLIMKARTGPLCDYALFSKYKP